jgi:hypothetical protein
MRARPAPGPKVATVTRSAGRSSAIGELQIKVDCFRPILAGKPCLKSFLRSTPAPQRQAEPGELLFEFLCGHDCFRFELRDHGAYGVEAQFLLNGEFSHGRRFDTRALAVHWAEEEGKAIENGET